MIPSERSHIHVSAATHPGMSGKNNEDNYAVTAHHLSQKDPTPSVLAVLADGVGGHLAGEVAAEIATETISKLVLESDGSNPQEILKQAIVQANKNVASQSISDDGQQGMGSTCACVWIIDSRVYTASLGDSRIYFIRDGIIKQVTTDHTWVQEAIEHGIITQDQARNHPRAHVIRRYLGSKKPAEPDFRLRLDPTETDQQALENQGMTLQPRDQFLLCSDGLTDLVDDHEILDALSNKDKDQALQMLIDLANRRGGHDNITIVILQVPLDIVKVETHKKPREGFRIKLGWQLYLAISLFMVVAAGLAFLLFFYVSRTPARATSTPTASAIIEEIPTEIITITAEVLQATVTPSPLPTETSILDTYTPWPTNTQKPEP